MREIDWDWVDNQLKAGQLGPDVSYVVTKLLHVLENSALPDEYAQQSLTKAAELAQGHSIAVQKPDERWGPVIPGAYQIRDTVRVKQDAYDGAKGTAHNGKRGRVTAARDGFVIVLYDDSPSIDIQHRHHPSKLQRLL